MRLICFPHAGGSARFFRCWADKLPATIGLLAVQYPGREDRLDEECVTHLGPLADAITRALEPVTDLPLVLFGHSLGAAVAYEVARRLDAGRGTAPAALFVSGRPAPSRQREQSLHLADDQALWDDVTRQAGTPGEVLGNPELRSLVLPALRGDYRLSETYQAAPGPLLRCPVVACLGDTDPDVTLAEAGCWREVTRAAFSLQVFAGDHFYLVPREAEVIDMVVRQLGAHAVSPAWPSAP
jgi:pyochelin biosynthesis protein PchC